MTAARALVAVVVIAGLLLALQAVLVWKTREDALDRALAERLSGAATDRAKIQAAGQAAQGLGGALGGLFSAVGRVFK